MRRPNLKKQVIALAVAGAVCTSTVTAIAQPNVHTTSTTTTTTTSANFDFEYIFVYNHNEPSKTLPVATKGEWTYRVTQGASLVSVTKDAQGLLITPKPGAKGDVIVVITDANGRDHEYKITVDNTAPTLSAGDATPKTHTTSNTWTFNGEPGTGVFTIPAGGNWGITSGGGNVDTRVDGDQLLITPKPDSNGKQFTVEIKDARGNTVRHTISIVIRPATKVSLATLESGDQFTIDDPTLRNPGTTWRLQSGDDLVTVEEKNGQLLVTAKHGVSGKATVLITDKTGNEHRFSITVVDTTPQVRVVTFNLYDGGDYTLDLPADATHRLVSGSDVVTVSRNGGELNVQAIDGANGNAVVEILDGKNRPTFRYTFKVESTVPVVKTKLVSIDITDRTQFRVTRRDQSNTLTLVSGDNLVDENSDAEGAIILDPKQGADGNVVIEEKDARGNVIVRTTLTITPVPIDVVTHNITSLDTLQLTGTNLTIVSGAEHVDEQKLIDSFTFVPRDGAQGQVIVESLDNRGRTDTRYVVTITPAAVPTHTVTIPNNATHRLRIGAGTHTVVRGGDIITVGREGDTLIITPRPGATGEAEIEVRNEHGQLIARYVVKVTEAATIRLTHPNSDGSITVTVPGSGGELIVLTDAPSHSTRPNPDNTWTIIRNDGSPVSGDIKLAWTSGDGTTITNIISIKLEVESTTVTEVTVIPAVPLVPATPIEKPAPVDPPTPVEPEAPREVDGKCIAALAGLTAPLLLLIPLGILTQVKIPGLEHVHAQINAAIQNVNAKLQEGLGIYDKERAEAAAGINQALAIVNPQTLALAGGSLVLVAAGLLIGDGVLRTCGYEEATSSHAVSQARSRKAEATEPAPAT
ncbi:hypothetical protein V6D40_10650 [Corynebacterium sp. Q4381]|uniref:hypothetical protein n=1 Tax=Corynebacterium sp. Marseille-Q4381 TaxID=3121597 RepID=UPI002FE66512